MKEYQLFEFTGTCSWETCKVIAENEDYRPLMELTKGKGHKFFINHISGGTHFSKCIPGFHNNPETWLCLIRPAHTYISIGKETK